MHTSLTNHLKNLTPKKYHIFLALLIVSLATWLPRYLGLYQYVTADEHQWLVQTARFYYAVLHHDFAGTYRLEHPGVTVFWAGAAGYAEKAPSYRDRPVMQLNIEQFANYLAQTETISLLRLLVAGRIFIILANTLVLALVFLYLRRLIGTNPALLGCLLIAFDPFHIALTRLLQPDGLQSTLMLLSVLACLCFIRERRIFDLFVSGAVAGLAWVTKTPSLVLIPIVGLIYLPQVFSKATNSSEKTSTIRRIFQYVGVMTVWGAVGFLIFALIFPAMWVQPVQTLHSLIGSAQSYAQEGSGSPVFFNGKIIESGKMGLEYWYFYPITYLWRSTPIVLLGLPLAIWGFSKKRYPFNQPGASLLVLGMITLVTGFTLLMTLGSTKFDRYLLPVYAPLDLLAGMGWLSLANWLIEKKKSPVLRFSPFLVASVLVLVQALLALEVYPYYLSYYNPLLGGGRIAPRVMQIGWGEGLDQAARYLKQKDQARRLRVISRYALGCVSYYFPGEVRYMTSSPTREAYDWEKLNSSDYVIVYINQQQRNINGPILDYLSHKPVEHSVWINGIEYARIYKLP
jgi:4-amino-4-deoxy-L-arabinose transferase-like glycosyltransferase